MIKNKTLYIYRERPSASLRTVWTVLFSHTYIPYIQHTKNRHGIPVMYFDTDALMSHEFDEMFKDYKKLYRKPNKNTIRKLQWTVLLDVYLVERVKMLLKRPGDELWQTAVKIFWYTVWVSVGLFEIPDAWVLKKDASHLTPDEIYTSLVLEQNQIKLN